MRHCSSLKRIALAGAALLAFESSSPRKAEALFGVADTVICTNCSTMLTQLAQLGKEADSLQTQIETKITTLRSYALQVQNGLALPTQVWGNVQGDVMQVRSLANAGAILSGNAGGIVSRLQSAGAYANMAANVPTNIRSQFDGWNTTIGNSLNSFGKTLGLQQSQTSNDAALIAAMQRHSATAVGQMQVLQAANELAAANAQQLMQVRQTIAAQAQMQANYYAVQSERQALSDAARLHFAEPVPMPGGSATW